MRHWFQIHTVEQVDSPALLVYPDRVLENIRKAIDMTGSVNKLRPHVKTNKMIEVCEMMIRSGISKFKCATIAEAEMLAMADAWDVLLAYQPTGPKIQRFIKLVKTYQKTRFSCLVDSLDAAEAVNQQCKAENIVLDVFIDLNIGMNRTGILPGEALELAKEILSMNHLKLAGLHGYDGHIHDEDPEQRQQAADLAFAPVDRLYQEIQPLCPHRLVLVMGGTPTFPIHAQRTNCECSPGTFVFWDWGYKHMLADMPFEYAALVLSRVISVIDDRHICLDLGHKSVAAENPLPRVYFLNAPDAKPIAQSEEHLVLEVPESSAYSVGDVLYGVPVHICPTVALYDKAIIISEGNVIGAWDVIARNRSIHF